MRQFYHAVTDDMRSYNYDIGWEKDVYPSPSFLSASISNGELFVAVVNEEIVAAMVVNHECNEGYQKVNWKQALNNGQFTVVHALCVATKMSGHGIAKAMVRHAIDYSRQMGMKAVVLAFVLPFLLMVGVVFVVSLFTRDEPLMALCGLVSLIPYYIIIYACRKKISEKIAFEIVNT